ncbi:MAG: ATP-binding protein [Rhodanobacteraceae bacterium]|nr:ATP-binding protein [Rhodanobacteraceae bacterium]
MILPRHNAGEAAVAGGARTLTARTLLEVCAFLRGDKQLPEAVENAGDVRAVLPAADVPDLADVRGQPQARRALEIAAAGSHSLLMIGPRAVARACWRKGCPASCRLWMMPQRWKSRPLHPSADSRWICRASIERRIARRITRPVAWHWSEAVRTRDRAKYRWRTTAFLFSMNRPEWDRRVLEEAARAAGVRAHPHFSCGAAGGVPCALPARCRDESMSVGYAGEADGRCCCQCRADCAPSGPHLGPLLDRIDLHVNVPRVDAA